MLVHIEPLKFLLLRHPHANRGLNGEEHRHAQAERPCECHGHAEELNHQLARTAAGKQTKFAVEETDANRAEGTTHTMHRDGSHRVVHADADKRLVER